MPRILITGNGFDLHHNLPTKYDDFMHISKFILENPDVEYDFDNIYSNIGEARFEKMKQTFKPDIVFDKVKIKELRELLKDNKFFSYFQKQHNIDTWIDFESRIEFVLKTICAGTKYFREKIVEQGRFKFQGSYSVSSLNRPISYLEILSHFDVINKGGSRFNFKRDYIKVEALSHSPIDVKEEAILELLYKQFMQLKEFFNYYLQLFVVPLYDKYKTDENFDFPYKFFDYHFTFNYTPTAERVGIDSSKTKYLHGRTNVKQNNLIFGIDDVFEEDENRLYLKFTKYFQKVKNNTDYHFLHLLKPYSQELFRFYFWGHSLDSSDKSYILEVFKFIKELSEKNKRIIVIYHNDNSYSNSIANLIKILGRENFENYTRRNILQFYKSGSEDLYLEIKMEQSLYF